MANDKPRKRARPQPGPQRVSEPDTLHVYEAKTRFSELIDRAAAGEEIVIAKAGTPVARIVPLPPPPQPRRRPGPGQLKGKIWVADDFDDPLPPEIQKYFDDPVIFPPDDDEEPTP